MKYILDSPQFYSAFKRSHGQKLLLLSTEDIFFSVSPNYFYDYCLQEENGLIVVPSVSDYFDDKEYWGIILYCWLSYFQEAS